MRKLSFLIFFVVMINTVVFAQDSNSTITDPVLWNQDIDPTTEWGKWLAIIVKPYWDKMIVAAKGYAEQLNLDVKKKLQPDELIEEAHKGYIDYCNGLRNIVPPPELSVYHSKILNVCKEENKRTGPEIAKDKDWQNKMRLWISENQKELTKVLMEHNVPQVVIEEFMRIGF